MSEHPKLGYIGLGNQGAAMAKRLLDWPGGLVVYDVRAEAMTPLAEAGASAAASVAEVAGADIISVTVLNDAQVREVITGANGLAAHARGHHHCDSLHDQRHHRRRTRAGTAPARDSRH